MKKHSIIGFMKPFSILAFFSLFMLNCEPAAYNRPEHGRSWGYGSQDEFAARDYIEKPYRPRAKGDEWLAGTIYFKKGTAVLTQAGFEQIRATGRNIERFLSEAYRGENRNHNYRIRLVGYPDTHARGKYNMHLALKRAEEVAFQLEKNGYPMSRTVVAAKNDFAEFSTVSAQRVEVWVSYADAPSFSTGPHIHIAWLIIPLLLLVLLAGFFIFTYNRKS